MDELLAQADPAVQAQIENTVIAFGRGGRSESEVMTNWRGFRELEALRLVAGDDERLVKQLAIYAVIEPRMEEEQVLEALLVLHVLNLKPTIPIRALAPYLDSDNKLLRGFVEDWFESHGNRGGGGAPRELSANYRDYLDAISLMLSKKEEVPTALVKFMYEQSPGQALLVFLRVDGWDERMGRLRDRLGAIRANMEAAREGRAAVPIPKPQRREQQREIHLAVHLIDDAIWLKENGHDERFQAALPEAMAELEKLAGHKQWWARLYVVAVMRQNPVLLQVQILRKLAEDENELVREAATSGRVQ